VRMQFIPWIQSHSYCVTMYSTLSPKGIHQAQAVGLALRSQSIDRLLCSPQQRALQTAYIISRSLALEPEVWLELSEHGLCWEEKGLHRSDIVKLYPQVHLPECIDDEGWARHWLGETDAELSQRMANLARIIEEMALKNRDLTIALVIHEGSGSKLLRSLMRIPNHSPVFFRHITVGFLVCGLSRKVRCRFSL
jgi:broad specificity phosphatase PhoE